MERFEFLINNLPDFIRLFIRQFSRILKMDYSSETDNPFLLSKRPWQQGENLGFYHVSQFSGAFNSRNTSFFIFCAVFGYVTALGQRNFIESGLIHAFLEQ